ncbi:hypothetical protein ACH5RR_020908 [Cinchona calisaya]|uniref:PGG domain-containing protein n=1 Tax=Cinchona calisaya TaxID=153742 RepID=A0ABD2ZGV7_9GENT
MHQMMWDVLWFKCVKYDSFPYLWQLQNSSGKTALQVFEENLETLRKDAEKNIKELDNCTLIVSVLIATINFAAVFTVPGGFEQNSGNPVFLKSKHWEFHLLMVYLAGGLYATLFTMGTLLGIIFLRFDTEDFYAALPWNGSTHSSVLPCPPQLALQSLHVFKHILLSQLWLGTTSHLYCSYLRMFSLPLCSWIHHT